MKITVHKIIVFCVFLTLIFTIFSGCRQNGGTPDGTKDSVGNSSDTTEDAEFCINKDNIKDYVIVVRDDCTEKIMNIAAKLRDSIKLRYGVELEIKSDFVSEGSKYYYESEYEILLGNVNRKQMKEHCRFLRENDSGYCISGNKLLIIGATDEAVKMSYDQWTRLVLANTSDVIMTKAMTADIPGYYKYESFKLNGTDIANYTIVYPSANKLGEKNIAQKLSDYIRTNSGYIVDCVTDKAEVSDYEIRIGETSRGSTVIGSMKDGCSYIAKDRNSVLLCGNSRDAIYSSFCNFIDKVAISGLSAEITADKSEEFKITDLNVTLMTYNVRYDNKKTADLIKLIKELDCDIFGCNEMTDHLAPRIMTEFKNGLGEYGYVQGKAFDSKVKLYDPIFYKKDKLELLESGSCWLSPTPERESKVNGADEARGCTYALFKDKTTGVTFVYIQTHLENTNWKSDTDGAVAKGARKLQLEALADVVKRLSSFPVILGGDLNTRKSNEFTDFFNKTGMADASTVTKTNTGNGTYVGSGGSISSEEKLDYFFVTKNNLSVSSQQAVDKKINGAYPSDHIPLKIEVTIRSQLSISQ